MKCWLAEVSSEFGKEVEKTTSHHIVPLALGSKYSQMTWEGDPISSRVSWETPQHTNATFL